LDRRHFFELTAISGRRAGGDRREAKGFTTGPANSPEVRIWSPLVSLLSSLLTGQNPSFSSIRPKKPRSSLGFSSAGLSRVCAGLTGAAALSPDVTGSPDPVTSLAPSA